MIKSVTQPKNMLFCEQYWTKALKNAKTRKVDIKLPYAFDITDINQMLVGCNIPMYYWLYETLRPNPNKMIKYIDRAFKTLPPTKQDLTLWRGINEPDSFCHKERIEKFNSRFDAKAGDIIYMPEYAFSSDDKKYSKCYTSSPNAKRAILYEIETPTGSKISQANNYIFPRSSKFECLDNTEIIENEKIYHIIKLRYVKPEEKDSPAKAFFKKLFSKVNIF